MVFLIVDMCDSFKIELERSDVRVDLARGPAPHQASWPSGLGRVHKIVCIWDEVWLQLQRFQLLGQSQRLASAVFELRGGVHPTAADLVWVPLSAMRKCEFMVHSCKRADQGSRCRPVRDDQSQHYGTRHDITHRNVFVRSQFALLR